MNKIKLKIVGTLLAIVISFLIISLYKNFPSFLTSILSPTNENILEYSKVLFGCIIFSGVIQKLYVIIRKIKINNICFSNFIGAILSSPIFLIMFIPVSFILGDNNIIKVILTIITILIAEIISYVIMNKKDYKFENKTIFFVIIIYILFAILTQK